MRNNDVKDVVREEMLGFIGEYRDDFESDEVTPLSRDDVVARLRALKEIRDDDQKAIDRWDDNVEAWHKANGGRMPIPEEQLEKYEKEVEVMPQPMLPIQSDVFDHIYSEWLLCRLINDTDITEAFLSNRRTYISLKAMMRFG